MELNVTTPPPPRRTPPPPRPTPAAPPPQVETPIEAVAPEGLNEERDRWLAFARGEFDQMVREFDSHKQRLEAELAALQNQISIASETIALQEVGLVFDGDHPTHASVEFSGAIKEAQQRRKAMAKARQAVSAVTNWTVNNSQGQGQKMVDDLSKLMLRAYNSEVDALVKTANATNATSKADQLDKKRAQIKKLGAMLSIEITPGYHDLARYEILTTGQWRAVQAAEKEADRAHRERLREEKKVREEIAKAEAKLDRELTQYTQALAALQARPDASVAEIESLQSQLAEAQTAREDITLRAANTRAGHVYVISNPGSMGDGVVKIGMTRRLDPMDRIVELGDASVPFRFCIHALIFAEDAVELEAALHRRFAAQRINRVNMRREFFRVPPQQVREALVEFNAHLVEWVDDPVNEEWEASR